MENTCSKCLLSKVRLPCGELGPGSNPGNTITPPVESPALAESRGRGCLQPAKPRLKDGSVYRQDRSTNSTESRTFEIRALIGSVTRLWSCPFRIGYAVADGKPVVRLRAGAAADALAIRRQWIAFQPAQIPVGCGAPYKTGTMPYLLSRPGLGVCTVPLHFSGS